MRMSKTDKVDQIRLLMKKLLVSLGLKGSPNKQIFSMKILCHVCFISDHAYRDLLGDLSLDE